MNIQKVDFSDIYEILHQIERKPGLFLLRPNLELLYSYISGIKLITLSNNSSIKNIEVLNMFNEFLYIKLQLKHRNNMSWFGAIAFEHGTEEIGFNKFFEYFNEFKNEQQ